MLLFWSLSPNQTTQQTMENFLCLLDWASRLIEVPVKPCARKYSSVHISRTRIQVARKGFKETCPNLKIRLIFFFFLDREWTNFKKAFIMRKLLRSGLDSLDLSWREQYASSLSPVDAFCMMYLAISLGRSRISLCSHVWESAVIQVNEERIPKLPNCILRLCCE